MNWIDRAHRMLPGLVAAETLWWPRGNVLIDDVGLTEDGLVEEMPRHIDPMVVYTAQDLTRSLLQVVGNVAGSKIIWPGMGALVMCRYMQIEGGMKIDAQRGGYQGEDPIVQAFSHIGEAIVFDDVVSSGATASLIAKVGSLVKPSLATWVVKVPRDRKLAVYKDVYAGLLLGGPGYVPCWTMSTFMRYPDRLLSYAQKYTTDPEEFVLFWDLVAHGF